MEPPANGHTSKWLGIALPLLREGGPVVSLALIVLGAAMIYFLLGEFRAQQQTTRELVERLLRCTQEIGRLVPPPP